MDKEVDTIQGILNNAIRRSRKILSEFESMQILGEYGVRFPFSQLANDVDEAVSIASSLGEPVVLKVHGEGLAHKTDVNGVALSLSSAEEIQREGARLLSIPGCTALLVEEHVHGERELVCGFLRDPRFGPMVMFGIGGVLTEIINDVAFRLAPMDEIDFNDLIQDIRSKAIFEEYRRQKPPDKNSIKTILRALNNIGNNYKVISQIDINPIKIKQDGSLIAVDALVVLDP
jgi:succinyl-CoA synthetase beta subunit